MHFQLDLHTSRDNLYTQSENHVKLHLNNMVVISCAKKQLIRDQVIYDTADTCLLIAHANYTRCSLSSLLNTPDTVNTSGFTLWFLCTPVCKSPASVITFSSGDISLSWHGKFINPVGLWSYIFVSSSLLHLKDAAKYFWF